MTDFLPQDQKLATQLPPQTGGWSTLKKYKSCVMTKFFCCIKTRFVKISADRHVQMLFLFGVAVVVTAFISGMLAYHIGERQARQRFATGDMGNHDKTMSAAQFQSMLLENNILKSEMLTLTQERDIALNNFHLIKNDVQSLKDELHEMKSLNQVLIQNAQLSDKPLQVLEMKIEKTANEIFEYRFELLIPSIEIKTITPTLTLLNLTSMVEIPLDPTHYDARGLLAIQGKFVMPDHFVPSQIRLAITIEDERVVKFYNWNVS